LILGSSLAQVPAQPGAFSGGVAGLVAEAGWVARGVLLLLLVFSLVSWAIILYKGLVLHRAHAQSSTFLEIFRKSSKFSEVNAICWAWAKRASRITATSLSCVNG
jgi:biopolymer transport protein TolQ